MCASGEWCDCECVGRRRCLLRPLCVCLYRAHSARPMLTFYMCERCKILLTTVSSRARSAVCGARIRIILVLAATHSSPHTSSHMFGHHPATMGLAGRKRHARFESSEALAELPAVARTAVELHGCCARVWLAEALLSQHFDGLARAGSAGTKSGTSAPSLVYLSIYLSILVSANSADAPGFHPHLRQRGAPRVGCWRPCYCSHVLAPTHGLRRKPPRAGASPRARARRAR